jgi:transglutaminase-like putative cysteine protease
MLNEYSLSINDHSIINPFSINSQLIDISKKISYIGKTKLHKALILFDSLDNYLEYDYRFSGYNDSAIGTFNFKKGVCLDMAILYTTMARLMDISSYVVDVNVDFQGKKVNHACSLITIVNGLSRYYLVDIAYHQFNVKHKVYKIKPDRYWINMVLNNRK